MEGNRRPPALNSFGLAQIPSYAQLQAVWLWYAGTLSWNAANLMAMLAFAGVGWSADRRRVVHAGDKRDVAESETTPAVIP